MAIVASANPLPGTMLLVKLLLPIKPKGQAAFEAKAKVMHSVFSGAEAGFEIGLSFVELPSASAAAVQQYLG